MLFCVVGRCVDAWREHCGIGVKLHTGACDVTGASHEGKGSPKTMSNAPTKYDDTLFAMMTQHESEMEFLNTIFGFLQRRSACFNGPKVSSLAQPREGDPLHQAAGVWY